MNQYTLDGVPLRDPELRWFTDRETGIRIVPARRIPELRFPGVDGISFIPRAPYDPGAVRINMYVRGATYALLRQHIEFLSGLFAQRGRLMELREHYDDNPNNDRVAEVTLASSADPQITSLTSATMTFILSIPGVFWRSPEVHEGTTPPLHKAPLQGFAVEPASFELPSLYGGNAPIDDLLIKVHKGTFGTATISDPASGNSLSVNFGTFGSMLATETLLIDTKNWNSILYTTEGNENNWSMSVPGSRSANHIVQANRGMGSMLIVEPTLNAQAEFFGYRLQGMTYGVNNTPHSGTTVISYRGRKAYL